jgi:hypothetical protein
MSFAGKFTLGEAEVLAVLGLIDVGMVGILVAVDTPTGMDTVLHGVDAGGMYGICTRYNVNERNPSKYKILVDFYVNLTREGLCRKIVTTAPSDL